ncbi:Diadenylate cyclase [Candidatus Promineifilum breve]|uniref:Diadenylate cyclase n=1 Tax=Candidatus Promineifilum breve TaxID=1806508 RepID=A0A160T6N1_9CHLR|nr:Diadenylate cyclase [Candidatus Promineifilum breve]
MSVPRHGAPAASPLSTHGRALLDTFDSVLERFALISYVDLIDILLVTLIIFGVLMLIRGTRAVQVLRGLLVLAAFVFILAQIFELQAFTWLVDNMLPVLLIAIPVIFQPELRRALEQLGLAGRYLRIFRRDESNPVVDAFKDAALRLSQRRHGALVVFEQDTGLQEYIDTGVVLDADPSAELFLTIFNKHTELHDGAIIVRGNRLAAAACVLPLSTSSLSDRQMGLRHRAALGISEVSDAVAVVVSEETGQVSIAHNGRILRRQDIARLDTILNAFLTGPRQPDFLGRASSEPRA